MTTIYAALSAVMTEVSHVAKRDENTHARYMFRGVDAVVNAVGPALRKHNVIVIPQVASVEYEVVQTSTGKPSTACRVRVAYIFYGPEGDYVETSVIAEAWDSGDKAAPKAMSVAFRTALLQTLALPTDEPDPDSHTYERAAPAPRLPPTPDPLAAAKARLWPLTAKLGNENDRRAWIGSALATRGMEATSADDLHQLADEFEAAK